MTIATHFDRKIFFSLWLMVISNATQCSIRRDKIDICETFSACNSFNMKFVIYLHRMLAEKKDHIKWIVVQKSNCHQARTTTNTTHKYNTLFKLKIFIWQRNHFIHYYAYINIDETIESNEVVHFNIKVWKMCLFVCVCVCLRHLNRKPCL